MTAVAAAPQIISAPSSVTRKKRYKPDLLIILTLMFAWVSVWRFQDLVPIIGKLKLSMVLEIVLLGVYLTQTSSVRGFKWAKSRAFYGPFILLGLMCVGLPFNLWKGQGLTFITKDFVPTVLLFVCLATGMRESLELEWFAFAHLVGATVYSAYIYLYVPVGANARLGELVFYDANDFGLLIVCTIPFALYFARPGVKFWKRIFSLAALGLFVQMLIKTGSRGGFIALIFVAVYVLFAYKAIPARLRVGAVVGGFLLLTLVGSAAYWDMMRTILHPKDDYNMTEPSGRKAVWKRGIRYMLARPVFGVGAAAFPQAEGTVSEISKEYSARGAGLKWSTAHNSFVLAGAELGVGGLVTFMTMIVGSFWMLFAVRDGPESYGIVTADDVGFARMLMGSLVAYCVAGFFVSATYFSYLYVILGLTIAQQAIFRRRYAHMVRSGATQAVSPMVSGTIVRPKVFGSHWSPSA